MVLKKNWIFVVLATCCLTSILFLVIPIISAPTAGVYDPWIDTNDDGIINYQDLYNFAVVYGTSGTPINKTNLLLELQSKIDSLNASLVALLSRVEALEAPESVTTERIADDAVTSLKLAAGAIPHNVTHSGMYITTSSTSFVDMEYTSVDITLTKESTLIIMFSAQVLAQGTGLSMIYVQAMVDTQLANPVDVILTQSKEWNSYSYTFYAPNVVAGTYTVKIQWKVNHPDVIGHVDERTLTVIALPV